jgi:Superinfection immunity protein
MIHSPETLWGLSLLSWGLLLLYALPANIASLRRHPQRWPIFWLTLLAGWTGVGWLVAFIWSVLHLEPRPSERGNRRFSS